MINYILPKILTKRKAPNRFMYDTLTSGQFRLLKPKWGKDLEFKLRTCSLEACPKYIALSYVWGRADQQYDIMVNGNVLAITAGLYEALTFLVPQVKSSGMLFWADGICINQGKEAEKERSHQVSLMKKIFEQSIRVYCWLGLPGPYTDLAIKHLNMYKSWMDECHHEVDLFRKDRWQYCWGDPGSDAVNSWSGLHDLAERSWWQRVWIAQEGTCNDDTRIFCGASSCHLDAFGAALQIRKYLGTTHLIDAWKTPVWVNMLLRLRNIRRASGRLTFWEVLRHMRNLAVSDNRDKVYAALGLASDMTAADFDVDYASKSLVDVYVDVVKWSAAVSSGSPTNTYDFLSETSDIDLNDFELVEGACLADGDLNPTAPLPSWVPDWRLLKMTSPLPKRDGLGALYQAGGILPPVYDISPVAFIVSGFCIDILEDVFPRATPNPLDGFEHERSFVGALSTVPGAYPYADGSTAHSFQHAGLSVLSAGSLSPTMTMAALELENASYLSALNVAYDKSRHQVKQTMGNRRAGTTTRGYLAAVPHLSRPGDRLCILPGGPFVYVLRKRPDNFYTLIGAAYLHGFMNGEAYQLPDVRATFERLKAGREARNTEDEDLYIFPNASSTQIQSDIRYDPEVAADRAVNKLRIRNKSDEYSTETLLPPAYTTQITETFTIL